MQATIFKVNNQKLKATLYYPDTLKPLMPGVMFIHGWATGEKNYIKRAKAIAEKGAICLTFALRGHETSEGKFEELSREDHLQDAVAAYDFLVSQNGVNKNKIGVCGVSYGGYLASILTAKRQIRWLALKSPALYKNDKFSVATAKLITEDPEVFSKSGVITEDNFSLQALSSFTGDILLVESENDTIVTHGTLVNYLDVLKEEKLTYSVIKGADHILSTDDWKNEFIKILSDWFEKKFLE